MTVGRVSPGVSRACGRGIQGTQRDLKILEFTTKFGVVTMEHVRSYAFATGGGEYGRDPASESAVYRRLRTLVRRGFLKHDRVLDKKPGVYRTTQAGARCAGVGLPAAQIDLSTLYHHLEVVDLFLEAVPRYSPALRWITEREIRQEVLKRGRGSSGKMISGSKIGRIPDGLLIDRHGERVAMELEIAKKRTDDYRRILGGYAERHRQRIRQTEDNDPEEHLEDFVESGGELDGVAFYVDSDSALWRVEKMLGEVSASHRGPQLRCWAMSTSNIRRPQMDKYELQLERDQEQLRAAHEKEKESYLGSLELTGDEKNRTLQEAHKAKNADRARIFHRQLDEEEQKNALARALGDKRKREREQYPAFEGEVQGEIELPEEVLRELFGEGSQS